MATIVFAGGNELEVSESLGEVLARIMAADGRKPLRTPVDGVEKMIQGWFVVTPAGDDEPLLVRPGAVAYLRPHP